MCIHIISPCCVFFSYIAVRALILFKMPHISFFLFPFFARFFSIPPTTKKNVPSFFLCERGSLSYPRLLNNKGKIDPSQAKNEFIDSFLVIFYTKYLSKRRDGSFKTFPEANLHVSFFYACPSFFLWFFYETTFLFCLREILLIVFVQC